MGDKKDDACNHSKEQGHAEGSISLPSGRFPFQGENSPLRLALGLHSYPNIIDNAKPTEAIQPEGIFRDYPHQLE
jgi:hypothetical protein